MIVQGILTARLRTELTQFCHSQFHREISRVASCFSAALSTQSRHAFAMHKEADSNHVKKVTGWEEDADKRQTITGALKGLGFKWNATEKAWVAGVPVDFHKVKNILDSLKEIPAANAAVPVPVAKKSSGELRVAELLQQWKVPLGDLLPKNIDQNRFFEALRVSLLTAERVVANSSDLSVYTACSKCAQLGLFPGPLQEVYFSTREGQIEFQIGYKGFLSLARRAMPNLQITANVVRGNDEFKYTLGDNPTVELIQNPDSGSEDITFAFVMISFPGGAKHLTVVDKNHVEKRRACSKGGNTPSSPWEKFQREMWLKTAIKDALRFVNLSPEDSKREDLKLALEDFKSALTLIHRDLSEPPIPLESVIETGNNP
ncbi:MAG: recombinase RecT [Chlamydiales bacterium]